MIVDVQFHRIYQFDSFGGSYVPFEHLKLIRTPLTVDWRFDRNFGFHLKLARQSWGHCMPHPLHECYFIIENSKAGTLHYMYVCLPVRVQEIVPGG